jgi:hypothetical protein
LEARLAELQGQLDVHRNVLIEMRRTIATEPSQKKDQYRQAAEIVEIISTLEEEIELLRNKMTKMR